MAHGPGAWHDGFVSESPTCASCGIVDDELVLVRRVYLRPDEGRHVVEPPEAWCIPCATQYPCEPVGEPGPQTA